MIMSNHAKKYRNIVPLFVILIVSVGLSCFVSSTSYYMVPSQETGLRRVIVFSLDSCNPEYMSDGYLPHLNEFIISQGFKFKVANTVLSSETQAGHTTMLTGAFPNTTGIFGNGLYFTDNGVDTGLVLDPAYRWAPTIFQALHGSNPNLTTAFVSGKWRLGPLLSQEADIVLTSPRSNIPIPNEYSALVGTPIPYMDGDLMDAWVFNAILQVVKKDDPEFAFVNLAQIDWAHHATGAFNANMDRCMREVDALFAGEVSGHYYFREFSYADSGLIPALLVLELVAQSGRRLSDLVARFRDRYHISGEINSEVRDVQAALQRLRDRYADGRQTEVDGLSVGYDDWHFNVRPSNTEPLLRLNLESLVGEADMERRRDEVLDLIRES